MSLNNYEAGNSIFNDICCCPVSLIGQGLTIPKVFRWLYLPEHAKEKDNKLMGERDEILSKLLDTVSTSPELKERLGKEGIDTDRLSQISGHTGSDSDTHSRDGMGGSPRLGDHLKRLALCLTPHDLQTTELQHIDLKKNNINCVIKSFCVCLYIYIIIWPCAYYTSTSLITLF